MQNPNKQNDRYKYRYQKNINGKRMDLGVHYLEEDPDSGTKVPYCDVILDCRVICTFRCNPSGNDNTRFEPKDLEKKAIERLPQTIFS